MELNPLTLTRTIAGAAIGTGWKIAARAVRLVTGEREERPQPARTTPRPAAAPRAATRPRKAAATPRATPPEAAAPPEAATPPAATPPTRAAPPAEPPEVVATSSDTDADVGPNIHVEEPWPDYRRMKAAEVVDRLAVADEATLAAVELYERTHSERRTVVEAARGRLRQASRPGRARRRPAGERGA
ncbi:MAG TPA: hypothetical protein VFZ89_02275 [Solirubrobacteraceae bacterium]